jgi:hypothetical protein
MSRRVTCPRLAILALVSIAILTSALVPVSRADAQPKTLVVTGYGGRWSDVMKKALVDVASSLSSDAASGRRGALSHELSGLSREKAIDRGPATRIDASAGAAADPAPAPDP